MTLVYNSVEHPERANRAGRGRKSGGRLANKLVSILLLGAAFLTSTEGGPPRPLRAGGGVTTNRPGEIEPRF